MKNLPLLQQHGQRRSLHNEVHSRPPEALSNDTAVFCVVMWADAAERAASRQWLYQLLRDLHLPVPDGADHANHLRLDLGGCRLRWELHTEFVSWTWMVPANAAAMQAASPQSASDAIPAQWLAGLPGQCLLAMNVWVLAPAPLLEQSIEHGWLYEDKLVASQTAEEQARIYTDFAIHPDGASRLFVLNQGLPAARVGRLVQRLIEIETYRMAALLGLPAARDTMDRLAATETELAHDYLWRIHQVVPRNGELVIFNRSHYEDVLVTRVKGWIDQAETERRIGHINDFERLLSETGTTIIKFFLHISKD